MALLAGGCIAAASASGRARRCRKAVETFDAAWRIVRDSHFDKTLNGVDWDAVAAELRPKAAAARTAGELRAVLRDMLGRLGQSHFAMLPATADSADGCAAGSERHARLRRASGRQATCIVTEVDADGAPRRPACGPAGRCGRSTARSYATLLASLPESLEPRLLQVEAWRLAHTRLRGPSGSRAAISFEDGSGAVGAAVGRAPRSRPASR